MSPKSAQKTAAAKKDPVKKETKGEPTKPEKKSAKAAKPEAREAHEDDQSDLGDEDSHERTPAIDQDELEEQEEEVAASKSSSGQGGNAAALAAAAGSSSEMSASFKNFRHHPDMENFYRFIYENDLRHEALAIIDDIIADKAEKKLGKPVKSHH